MKSSLLCLALAVSALPLTAGPLQSTYQLTPDAAAPTKDPLDQPVSFYRTESKPVGQAFSILGRSYGVTFMVEPEVAGNVQLEVNNATLRDVVNGLTIPYGYYCEPLGKAYTIRKFKVVNYYLDYPQLTRSGQGSSSVNVSGSSGSRNGNYGLGSSTGSIMQAGSTNSSNGNGNNGGGGGGSDSTSISITQTNQNDFWNVIEGQLKAMLGDGEKLVLNKFSGIAQISASPRRHEVLKEFIDALNFRINRQVDIEAKIIEVTLNDSHQLGVDWTQAATMVGGLNVNGASTSTAITALGGASLGSTFTASMTAGKISAIITALAAQGEVHTVSQPRVRTLNNQTAFVKVGVDEVFFSLASSTVIGQPGTGGSFATTQDVYTQNSVTIGTVLALTPQVSSTGAITIDVLPALTRLNSVSTSPDNKQTAPNTEVKTASTVVRLKDGEAALIGGLIFESEQNAQRGVPGMSRIPIVGKAFRTDVKQKSRTELIIFLTAHLLDN